MSLRLSSLLLLLFAGQQHQPSGTPILTIAAASDLTNLEAPLQQAFEKTSTYRIRW
jgi:hypothetical protein